MTYLFASMLSTSIGLIATRLALESSNPMGGIRRALLFVARSTGQNLFLFPAITLADHLDLTFVAVSLVTCALTRVGSTF